MICLCAEKLTTQHTALEKTEVGVLSSPSSRMSTISGIVHQWIEHAGKATTLAIWNAFRLWDEPPSSRLPLHRTHLLVFLCQLDLLNPDISTAVTGPFAKLLSRDEVSALPSFSAQDRSGYSRLEFQSAAEPRRDPRRLCHVEWGHQIGRLCTLHRSEGGIGGEGRPLVGRGAVGGAQPSLAAGEGD